MANDWIKVRICLRQHPKVIQMAKRLKADKWRVIGALIGAWAIFDEHADDGALEGYTDKVLDNELGWSGFSEAMAEVGWLEATPSSLVAPRFDTHNGKSARRRASETARKQLSRAKPSASDADKVATREEKRRELPPLPPNLKDASQSALDKAAGICNLDPW